ncbi:uncharacterized protein B0I36DRAFT_158615 [Microdochium trichocladiopsis]|uniref:C2H2-type domain-containing protein n=1 Tax=Microdochium trichocladiopsis TaxID=1682393 RepID=A0A9P8Y0B6_9PEZI|nr:uncharacterized protein B0I36DRAFT_158615 [Microdochium trichocladiopsis]KAH7026432.1 hypothetical protein B0I36DRAFT_158615 [Microdochium trichocladiopsis]
MIYGDYAGERYSEHPLAHGVVWQTGGPRLPDYASGPVDHFDEHAATWSYHMTAHGSEQHHPHPQWQDDQDTTAEPLQLLPQGHGVDAEFLTHGQPAGYETNGTERPRYQCVTPGCKARPFKRIADLNRHTQHTHADSPPERLVCDYKRCTRHKDPFTRRDHYRDHYRTFHKEDIERRGGDGMAQEPSVSKKWWRCRKCLDRVVIAQNEWQCPRCKEDCDSDRRARRGFP